MKSRRCKMVVSFCLALALGLAGCGDDDTGGGGSAGTGGGGAGGGTGGAGGGAAIPLTILVTNDDGFDAEGINALVEGLLLDSANTIVVAAPARNRSGSGDMTDCPPGDVSEGTTIGGYPATAVDGCPADAVNYALDNLFPEGPPDVVISGINDTQNVGSLPPNGFLSQISGTIGAAKTAARRGVPAFASSQGEGDPILFEAGVVEVLALLSSQREAIAAGTLPTSEILSINIPSCNAGTIRNPSDPLMVPLGTENPNSFVLTGPQDCEATGIDPDTDINAFFTGYVTVTAIPAN